MQKYNEDMARFFFKKEKTIIELAEQAEKIKRSGKLHLEKSGFRKPLSKIPRGKKT